MRACNCEQAQELRRQIETLESAIKTFCDWAEAVLPMPVHPATGRLMEIGRYMRRRNSVIPDSLQIDAPAEGALYCILCRRNAERCICK
jgi:hypothetical protein